MGCGHEKPDMISKGLTEDINSQKSIQEADPSGWD